MTSFRDLSQIAAKSEYRERKEVNREPATHCEAWLSRDGERQGEREGISVCLCSDVMSTHGESILRRHSYCCSYRQVTKKQTHRF